MAPRRSAALASALVLTVTVAACASSSSASKSKPRSTTKPAPEVTGTVTVSAAASLTDAFAKIGTDFEAAHRNVTVAYNFGSSSTLATQIQQGAPADVFASADQANVTKLATAGLVNGTGTVFARNELVIVTGPGNPKGIRSLADLATVGVVSLCGETVPCGKYAGQALTTAGVTIPAARITRGQDVKATLAAVTTGDADAAIVYVTDAKAAGSSVDSVTIPDAQNVIATYPIAITKASANVTAARAFVAFVAGAKGQATLRSFGFLPPS
ncbi:MAG: molybdate ABC transporter substrate-binding protein [Acidimicrobiia bacterium]